MPKFIRLAILRFREWWLSGVMDHKVSMMAEFAAEFESAARELQRVRNSISQLTPAEQLIKEITK